MSKLSVDQKSIKDLFQGKNADFLIPDYQRPYAWGEEECQTLWDDIFSFAFPDNDKDKFDADNEYFLGPIVTFKNSEGKQEVIDGQQRLTTLMLLLRAFYGRFLHMQDGASKSAKENIEKCIWKTDEFGKPDTDRLKIDSEVATDKDKDEFLRILRTGKVDEGRKNSSNYETNYRFFLRKIEEFVRDFSSYLPFLPTRLMNNCILLPIEAESQDTALRIFSTLNDRGLPLSDSDIFKAQFYKFFAQVGKKNEFVEKWKDLEALCNEIFHPIAGTPMDEIFTRYMYFQRAKKGIKSSTTEALRNFYERDGYCLLKQEKTFEDLLTLASFWNDVSNQDTQKFSKAVLRRLFILNYAPNGMWTYLVSVYFMQNKDEEGLLEEGPFCDFLDRITGFIWTYSVTNPGVGALRTPVYEEMLNIVNDRLVQFGRFRFEAGLVERMFSNFTFTNNRPITRSMLTWWAFQDDEQEVPLLKMSFDIEHIFARNRQEKEGSLSDPRSVELLGNKALLERKINIRATDYSFEDKKKYYLGFVTSSGVVKEGTRNHELQRMAENLDDFAEEDIKLRNKQIIDALIAFLQKKDLISLEA